MTNEYLSRDAANEQLFFERNSRLETHHFRDDRRTFAQWLKHKARIVWALIRQRPVH